MESVNLSRRYVSAALASAGLSVAGLARAWPAADLGQAEASKALRTVLEQCALAALRQLSQRDGFMRTEKVRIPLPEHLHDASRLLKSTGYGRSVEELILAMNRVADRGVGPMRALLMREIAELGLPNPQIFLQGTGAVLTPYFASSSHARLYSAVQVLQQSALVKTGVATKYNQVAGRMTQLGLSAAVDFDLPHFLADKTLQAVYTLMQDEEVRLRAPAGSAMSTPLPPPTDAQKANRPIFSKNPL